MASPPPEPPSEPPADPRDRLFDTAATLDGLGRRAGNASTLILAMMAVKFVLQLGSIAVLARLVPPSEQGIIAMAMPVIMIAMTLSNFGLAQSMVQSREMTHDLATALFWLNAAFGTAFMLLVAGLGGPAAQFYDQPRVAAVFWALSVTVLLSAIAGQYIAILRRRMRIRAVEMTNFGALVAGIAAAILAALAGWGFWAIVIQQVVNAAVLLALLLAAVRWLPSGLGRFRFALARDALRFGGFLAAANLVKMMSDNMGVIFAGRLFSDAATGLLYRAGSLADMPRNKILTPLSGAFVPTLSRLQDDPQGFRVMFIRVVNRANLLMLPVGVLLVAGAGPITAVMLGPDWAGAAPLLALISLKIFVIGMQNGLRWCFIATGVTRPLLVLSVIDLALVTAALSVGAGFGLVWMAACYVMAQISLTFPVLVVFALRATPVRLSTLRRAVLGDLAFAVGLAGAIVLLRPVLPEVPALAELAIIMALVGAAFFAKIMATPAQRADVFKVLSQVTGKLASMRRAP